MWLERIWQSVYAWLFYENRALTAIFFVALGALSVAAFVGYSCKSVGAYAALAATIGGGSWLVASLCGVSLKAAGRCIAVLCVYGGLSYLVLLLLCSVKGKIKKRREARAKIERKLQFTLPDSENSFVRARLNTVLKPTDTEDGQQETLPAQELKISYARQLLTRLKETQLSTADRLKTDELAGLISVYMSKDGWTANDLRALNDAFSGVLKLSAKYSV
ncbi:MAG: hypothetical protein IJ514_05735 [Clostridia bacterium]|nr:hypothetical protein [Clostridia bacterium]